MRKWMLITVAAWLGLGAATAFADVTITAAIDKTKDKDVIEFLTKDKFVTLLVDVVSTPDKFAESETIINQVNTENEACENCAEKADILRDSANTNSGVLTVNQAAGNMNNQGSAISIAIDQEPPDATGTGFAESQASVEQMNTLNLVDSINILFRDAVIENSINDNAGVVHVNQSPGQMNNQANALSIAVSLLEGVALSEADLGQFNVGNQVLESNVFKSATIANSVNNNAGVIGVNQSSGSMANQANVVSFAAAAQLQ